MTNAAGGVAGDVLRSFVDRIERLEIDKKAISEDIKEVMAEAKSAGFETKIIRKCISRRKMEKHERDEEDALMDIYMHAIEGNVANDVEKTGQGDMLVGGKTAPESKNPQIH